ncbi:hypothetical protein EYR41_007959 [Orbilia oligospora]|uniref:NADP-dependent oxidoreductase domain-containing protein n=1 Tax=Orbilia oligospora TaxID=2813651 RepID=A0A8H2HLU2_ORBOL|nr:hypothetical protein EYR41_007959 [Orbilia oligospora]
MLRCLPRSRVAFRPLPLHPHRRPQSSSTTHPIPLGEEEDPLDDFYAAIRAGIDPQNPTSYTPTAPLPPKASTTSQRQQKIQNLINRPIPTVTLSNGVEIPALGYQAYVHRDQKPKPWKDLIWKGYRHIDMNSAFNQPETFLQNSFWSLATNITRSDLFVSAKLESWWHHDPKAALYNTLLGLRTGYLDLWVMRWPISWVSKANHSDPPKDKNGREIDFIQAWKGMEEQFEAGKVRSLGVANFSKAELDLLLEHAKHKPVVHQMEITPYLQQKEFVEYNKSLGITPVATMPMGTRTPERGAAYEILLLDTVLVSIAEKYRITVRQLLTAWHISNGMVTIPYLEDSTHAHDNLRVDSLTLEQEDLDEIASLERGQRIYKPRLLGYYPFSDLTDPDLALDKGDLPRLEDVYARNREKAKFAKQKAEEEEEAHDLARGHQLRFGTSTYAGTVYGWLRSMDGSRKAADNKTGHFGTKLRPPKKKKR